MLEKLFEEAKKYGITRGAIGIEIYGRKKYARIYAVKNPTSKTLDKIERAINKIKKEKNIENKN